MSEKAKPAATDALVTRRASGTKTIVISLHRRSAIGENGGPSARGDDVSHNRHAMQLCDVRAAAAAIASSENRTVIVQIKE